MSAFSKRVEREDEEDRLEAMSALFKARNAWGMQDMQLPLIKCVVCDDRGCEFCPKVQP